MNALRLGLKYQGRLTRGSKRGDLGTAIWEGVYTAESHHVLSTEMVLDELGQILQSLIEQNSHRNILELSAWLWTAEFVQETEKNGRVYFINYLGHFGS